MSKIIAIEGIDGAGKSLQSDMLYKELKNDYNVTLYNFPFYDRFFGSEIGAALNPKIDTAVIEPKSMALWYAMDRWQCLKDIDKCDVIIANRYTLSNMAYQSARAKSREQYNMIDWIFELEHRILNIPIPDIYVVLDMDVNSAFRNNLSKSQRSYMSKIDLDIYERDRSFLQNVSHIYKKLADKYDNIVVLSCDECEDDKLDLMTPERIHKSILNILHINDII